LIASIKPTSGEPSLLTVVERIAFTQAIAAKNQVCMKIRIKPIGTAAGQVGPHNQL